MQSKCKLFQEKWPGFEGGEARTNLGYLRGWKLVLYTVQYLGSGIHGGGLGAAELATPVNGEPAQSGSLHGPCEFAVLPTPTKINRRVARFISTLADYDLELKHLPGTKNRADPLSQRPDHDNRSEDNQEVTALPDELFV